MSRRCKNCKWWEPFNVPDFIKFRVGVCNCPKFIEGSYQDMKVGDELTYEGCFEGAATFEVGEMFGCVHWEKRGR